MRRCTREIRTAITTGRKDSLVRAETVNFTVIQIPRHNTDTFAIITHDQIKHEIFNEELGLMFQRLRI